VFTQRSFCPLPALTIFFIPVEYLKYTPFTKNIFTLAENKNPLCVNTPQKQVNLVKVIPALQGLASANLKGVALYRQRFFTLKPF